MTRVSISPSRPSVMQGKLAEKLTSAAEAASESKVSLVESARMDQTPLTQYARAAACSTGFEASRACTPSLALPLFGSDRSHVVEASRVDEWVEGNRPDAKVRRTRPAQGIPGLGRRTFPAAPRENAARQHLLFLCVLVKKDCSAGDVQVTSALGAARSGSQRVRPLPPKGARRAAQHTLFFTSPAHIYITAQCCFPGGDGDSEVIG